MKNLLRSTLYLAVFALAGVLFQISCSNAENATSTPSTTQTGKLIYYKQTSGQPIELWISNNDGTNQTQIPAVLPANVEFSVVNSNRSSVKISPDGLKVYFVGFNTATNVTSIYCCETSGSNLQEIVNGGNGFIELGGLN